MDFVAPFKNFFNFHIFVQVFYICIKCILVCFNLLRSLCAYMSYNTCNIFFRIQLQWLNEFLEVASVPVNEATLHQSIFFNLLFFCKFNMLDPLEVPTVLCVNFFFNQLFKSFWLWKESEVLYNLDLFLFCFFTDAYISSLKNFWAQVCFTQIFLSFVPPTITHCGVFSDHLSY